ncbi:tetratricopeptide repeat protein [Fusibacter sp. 3D3]|uniref:tetratricopeptide repeat protein n=1 Tax=Fusibacter sp. 3D3 TaxID=1048380 RepID=UPI000852C907|nr:tetratricopeptide repeat protein [Fusibacter sp. 3D3]GAU75611.1 hypothetical protein F3D3_0202 [Fusibacter sp. 3D3]
MRKQNDKLYWNQCKHLPTLNTIFDKLYDEDIILNFDKDKRSLDRVQRIETFFTEELAAEIKQRSRSYLSWFLNCEKDANPLMKKLCGMLKDSTNELLSAMEEKVYKQLYIKEEPQFENDKLKIFIIEELVIKFSVFIQNPKYLNRLEFCCDINPSRALSRLIIFVALGPYAPGVMELILPEEDSRLLPEYSIYLNSNSAEEPESICKYAELLYKEGHRDQALILFTKVAEDICDPIIFCRIGKMLQIGDGCNIDEKGAIYYFKRSAVNSAEGCYEIAQCYRNGIGCERQIDKARHYLERSAEHNFNLALRDIGSAYYNGDIGYPKDVHIAKQYFERGGCLDNPKEGDMTCQYMLATIIEKETKESGFCPPTALGWYENAARNGSIDAKQRLWDLNWNETLPKEILKPQKERAVDNLYVPSPRVCFINTISQESLIFVETLPGSDWKVILCDCEEKENIQRRKSKTLKSKVEKSGGIFEIYEGPMVEAFEYYLAIGELFFLTNSFNRYVVGDLGSDLNEYEPDLLFFLFNPNQDQNLSETVSLLEYLYKLKKEEVYEQMDAVGLSNRSRFFVKSEIEFATLILDSVLSGMRDCFFAVRICDPAKDAAEKLLSIAPLFLPCLKEGAPKNIGLVLFGSSESVLWLIKDAISVAYMEGISLSITVIDTNVKSIESRFRRECQGIYKAHESIKRVIPVFYKFDFNSDLFNELFSYSYLEMSEDEKKISVLLKAANYIVVGTDNEHYNLKLATDLRTWYLKYDPTFKRNPFITAYCKDSHLAWQAKKLAVVNEDLGYDWFSNYNIHCFGAFSQLYTYQELVNGLLEKRARTIHLSYYSDSENVQSYKRAYKEFFSRQYNRDSSLLCAIHLIYRVYAVGIRLSEWYYYGDLEQEIGLADAYHNWLTAGAMDIDNQRLLKASQMEHERWNAFMLTRGWDQASTMQVMAYIQRGNPRQQLYIAKLHPYICAWDEIGDDDYGIQSQVKQIMGRLHLSKTIPNIKKLDENLIKLTCKFIG